MKRLMLKNIKKGQRKKRNRAKIFGTAEKPRISVFRSNRYIGLQLIDDSVGRTLLSMNTKDLKLGKKTKVAQSKLLGEQFAEKALKLGIKKVIFNKGPYKYHGRVKAVADGARSKGLEF